MFRIARRFMPRLKTGSEVRRSAFSQALPVSNTLSQVATLNYVKHRTRIPVPTVFHFDSNPYNRLGGEYILMSRVSFPLPNALTHPVLVLSSFVHYYESFIPSATCLQVIALSPF